MGQFRHRSGGRSYQGRMEGGTFPSGVKVKEDSRHIIIEMEALEAQAGFMDSTAFHTAYIGGYGSGKTYVCAMKALVLSIANVDLPGMILAPTERMAEEVTGRAFREILEDHSIPHKYLSEAKKIQFPWGSDVYLRSAHQPNRLKGSNLAWVGMDEAAQMKEEAWMVALSRVRHPAARIRQLFLTTTPEGFNWVYRHYVEEPPLDSRIFWSATRENIFLGPEYLARMEEVMPSLQAEQYLEGRFVNTTSGRVYYAFDRRIHIRNQKRDSTKKLILACDFNVNPMVWVIAQEYGERVGILDEIVLREADTAQAVGEFRARFETDSGGVELYGDAAGKHRDTRQVGRTDYTIIKDLMGEARMRIPSSNPGVKDRVNAVNLLLQSKNESKGVEIDPRCKELIKDLETLVYKEGSRGVQIDKSDPARTHASDAFGYYVSGRFPIRGRAKGYRF